VHASLRRLTIQPAASGEGTGRRAATTALLVAVATLSAGCGMSVSTRASRYSGELGALQRTYESSTDAVLRNAARGSDRARAAAAVGRYETLLARVQTALRRLHAPPRASPLQRRLVRTLTRYGGEVRRLIAALAVPRGVDPRGATRRFASVTQGTRAQVRSTIAAIDARVR